MARFLQVMIAGMVLADANCMPTRGLLRGGVERFGESLTLATLRERVCNTLVNTLSLSITNTIT